MSKKRKIQHSHVVIFVEGDTDSVFFTELIRFYREHSLTPVSSCEIQNMKGVSKYNAKFALKLKNDIIPRALSKGLVVRTICCSYDTDVFEFAEEPVVDWHRIKKTVQQLGIPDFIQLKVEKSIEDWLLDDIKGLCSFLKIKYEDRILAGSSGYEKMTRLFRKGNIPYNKGTNVGKFIQSLDFGLIREKRKDALKELESALSVKLKTK